MDSSGLHVLLAHAFECATEGTTVCLAAARGGPALRHLRQVHDQVAAGPVNPIQVAGQLLQLTEVDRHLPVYATVEEAIVTMLVTPGNPARHRPNESSQGTFARSADGSGAP
ncbi:hypothetical protein [Nonomuraea insulae]|uniref:STAS domain-containing protein n=1 Tax=Nonomuraea insulae TaxID=1616787 RepID=A0ABW1CGV4_9ACTN